jgi:hypothetical protein
VLAPAERERGLERPVGADESRDAIDEGEVAADEGLDPRGSVTGPELLQPPERRGEHALRVRHLLRRLCLRGVERGRLAGRRPESDGENLAFLVAHL